MSAINSFLCPLWSVDANHTLPRFRYFGLQNMYREFSCPYKGLEYVYSKLFLHFFHCYQSVTN
jgi:hypothetical protein